MEFAPRINGIPRKRSSSRRRRQNSSPLRKRASPEFDPQFRIRSTGPFPVCGSIVRATPPRGVSMPQRTIHYADDTMDPGRDAARGSDLDRRSASGADHTFPRGRLRPASVRACRDRGSAAMVPRPRRHRRLAAGRSDPARSARGHRVLRGRRDRRTAAVSRSGYAAQASRRHYRPRPSGFLGARLRERPGALAPHASILRRLRHAHGIDSGRPRAPLHRCGLRAGALPAHRPGGDHPRRRRRPLPARTPAGLGAGPAIDCRGIRRARGDSRAHGGPRDVRGGRGAGRQESPIAARNRGPFRNR